MKSQRTYFYTKILTYFPVVNIGDSLEKNAKRQVKDPKNLQLKPHRKLKAEFSQERNFSS